MPLSNNVYLPYRVFLTTAVGSRNLVKNSLRRVTFSNGTEMLKKCKVRFRLAEQLCALQDEFGL